MDPTNIKLLLTDVDGVLTDGSIIVHSDGSEEKRFFVRDGSAIVAWRKCGLPIGIITGRPSVVTTHRAKELGVDYVEQCQAMGKIESYEDICKRAGVTDSEVAYIGDDLADLPVLTRVAYPIAVADACAEVRGVAKYVTAEPGGRGAVRDAIEHLLKSMGQWDEVLERYGV
ncbi:MAG: HAD hydrolase family protein [Phycisphaera sp.]|nr:HAD hydrolase family protein [Phycisphaera sp.]